MDRLRASGETALLHCAGRTRSIIGACTLKAAGYDGPYAIFRGGTQAWQLEGLEREFNAARVFARESEDNQPAMDFLYRWSIPCEHVDSKDLADFLEAHRDAHLFDVSDDAARGEALGHGIVKISGTNLIQQTDQSIARYHVPVLLFDQGSGSRAAFAAYWLQAMGFVVRVVYLDAPLAPELPADGMPASADLAYPALTVDQLLVLREKAHPILDFRPSRDFGQQHLQGSRWQNIGERLAAGVQNEPRANASVVVIGTDRAHASDCAAYLDEAGTCIAGIYAWKPADIDADLLTTVSMDEPIDECALFAGRHHGNLQDSRDYLAWEEALPEQIDRPLHDLWLQRLAQTPKA